MEFMEEQEIFVPGRLCVLGEHTDWAASYREIDESLPSGSAIICTTNEGIFARIKKIDRPIFEMKSVSEPQALSVDSGPDSVTKKQRTGSRGLTTSFDAVSLKIAAEDGGFYRYAAGTATVLLQKHGDRVGSGAGLAVDNHRTTLPVRKGLISSSAAVCCLVAKAFSAAFGLGLTAEEVMEAAYEGELAAGSACGRLDQCCALGANAVGYMTFDGQEVSLFPVAPAAPLHFVVADVGGRKDTGAILRALHGCYPPLRGAEPTQPPEVAAGFRAYAAACRGLVWEAAAAVEEGNARALGGAMRRAQEAFDAGAGPACPAELGAPRLRALLAEEAVGRLSWGAKGVGSQGDGSAQFLARGPREQAELVELLRGRLGLSAFPLTVAAATAAGGRGVPRPLAPRRCRAAVVVAAGLSTRMFPASAVVKKELFPVVGPDGECKPVALAIVESLVAAGIEKIIFVVQARDIPVFQGFFRLEALGGNEARLKPAAQARAERIRALGNIIEYAVQETQDGFGHAVWCARERVLATLPEHQQDAPFLLALGDHLYRRGHGLCRPAAAQLAEAFLRRGVYGRPMLGLKAMAAADVGPYGVAAGTATGEGPSPAQRRRYLAASLRDEVFRRDYGYLLGGPRAAAAAAAARGEEGAAAAAAGMGGNAAAADDCDSLTDYSTDADGAGSALVAASGEEGNGEEVASGGGKERTGALGLCSGVTFDLHSIVEKPTVELARDKLCTPGLAAPGGPGPVCLVVFGQYLLPAKRTFDILGEHIEQGVRERGEVQLTAALARMLREDGGHMLGHGIHGEALDMGIPGPYVETMARYARPWHPR